MNISKPLAFLFTTADLGGNVSPIMTIVARLTALGHRVTVMSDEFNRPEAVAAGARFVSWTRAPNRAVRARETDLPDWGKPVEEGLSMVVGHMCGTASAYAQDTIEELRANPADLVVCFDMLLGPMVGCEAIGQRLALLGTMISFFPLQGIPPLGSALAPAKTATERALEAKRTLEFETVFDCGLPALNAARAAFGLPALAHVANQLDAAAIHWLGTARAFDFESAVLRPAMRYAGPVVGDPQWSEPWSSPWSKDDQRPLVLVGFSTSFQDHVGVLQRIIDAAARLPVRMLVTLGGAVRPDELTPAENTALRHSAPHTQVMPEASLVVTHGGHGTVMAALINRLPMLIIPHGRDQGDNAVRITERGAGLCLPASASVEELHAALSRLLEDRAFRAAAQQMGNAVVAEARASTLIEDLEALAAQPTAYTLRAAAQ